jgi:hypothetical protein
LKYRGFDDDKEEPEPPKSAKGWVDWTTGQKTRQEREYAILVDLTLVERLTSEEFGRHNRRVSFADLDWAADYIYSAPSGTFSSGKGDRPIQFLDAGSGKYHIIIFKRRSHPKKGRERRK